MNFWDKVQQGVGQAAKEVQQGVGQAAKEAEKQANIAKLSLDINGIRGDITKRKEELGSLALNLYRNSQLTGAEGLAPVVEQISTLESQIADLEKRIEELRTAPAAE